jgi:ElaB/YqjD/DUF883 family membrane-anchored ribosome-binding protein
MPDVQSSGNGHGAGFLDHLNVDDAAQVMEQTRAALDQALESAGEFIRERPIACLAGALAIGYVIGKIVSR